MLGGGAWERRSTCGITPLGANECRARMPLTAHAPAALNVTVGEEEQW